MTPELITQWAREAGLLVGDGCSTKHIEAFAALVAAHEREECAERVTTLRPCMRGDCDDLATAIRARSSS